MYLRKVILKSLHRKKTGRHLLLVLMLLSFLAGEFMAMAHTREATQLQSSVEYEISDIDIPEDEPICAESPSICYSEKQEAYHPYSFTISPFNYTLTVWQPPRQV